MATSPKITIEGVEYAADELNEEARAQLVNIRATDQEIARLQIQLAIAQTARASYSRALVSALPQSAKAETADAPVDTVK